MDVSSRSHYLCAKHHDHALRTFLPVSLTKFRQLPCSDYGTDASCARESVKASDQAKREPTISKLKSRGELFVGRSFDRDLILPCTRSYLRYKLGLRDLLE